MNDVWWDRKTLHFYSILDKNHDLQGHAGADLLYRDVAEDGPQAQSALNDLLANIRSHTFGDVEAESYEPEILYRYGVPDTAYAQILDLTRETRKHREYPEVSYSVIGAIVSGLIGVTVEPFPQAESPEIVVRTYPELTPQTAWAELRNFPVRANELAVRQEGTHKTAPTNLSGPALNWKAMLPGAFESLLVGGKPVKAHTESLPLGRTATWVSVSVGIGEDPDG